MNKLPENLDLTVAQLCLSPQQLVLALRHGAQDESGQFEQREVYQALQGMLAGREIRHIKVPFKVGNIPLVVTVNRVYEHEGNLYRIVIATEERMNHLAAKSSGKRVIVPSENDALLLNLSRYLVFLKTGQQVENLYATYHVVSPMQEIMEQYKVEVETWDFSRVERVFKAKVLALQAAYEMPDHQLPACTESEKWVYNGVSYNCAMHCPARGVCCQKRTEFANLLQIARSMGSSLGDDLPGETTPATGQVIVVDEGGDPTGIC